MNRTSRIVIACAFALFTGLLSAAGFAQDKKDSMAKDEMTKKDAMMKKDDKMMKKDDKMKKGDKMK